MLRTVSSHLKRHGLLATARAVGRRVLPRPIRTFASFTPMFRERLGFEIGGPSPIFEQRGLFPIYPLARRIDNALFASDTVWAQTAEGATFRFDRRREPGYQHFVEARDLTGIPSSAYDFVLSSHALEHVANPLLALESWKRVLKPNGAFLIVLPHKDGAFDHRRPVTSLEHLVEDFERNTPESDLTHLDEIVRLHDLSLDPGDCTLEEFKARSQKNVENRCLHHHVFDTELAVRVVDQAGFQVRAVELARPMHIFVLAQKLPGRVAPANQAFLDPRAEHFRSSPFPSDRRAHR